MRFFLGRMVEKYKWVFLWCSRIPQLACVSGESMPTASIQMNVINVLVVDDDIAVCRILHRMLSNEQRTVQTSQSVAHALGTIEQKPFDVYVIDYRLPDGSGLDVAERIRSKWGDAPIILISGYDPSTVALRAEKLRITDFLEKPFSRELICDAVKKAIGSPSAVTASESERDQTEGSRHGDTVPRRLTGIKRLWQRLRESRS
jgi:DNA-binding NtrC family response regulator